MRVLIVGGGDVGIGIASGLTGTHEVVVLDADPERADALRGSFDVLVVEGDGTSMNALSEAGIEETDIVVAATHTDETNLAVCATASAVGDAFTIAQVRAERYVRTWRNTHGTFGANYLVNSRLRAAEAIARIVDLPMARDLETFSNDTVQLVEFEIDDGSPLIDEPLSDLAGEELVPAAVLRDEQVHTRAEQVTFEEEDRLVVIGTERAVTACSKRLTPERYATSVDDVVLLGGYGTAYHVARSLESRGRSPRMVVESEARAREYRNGLTETTLLVDDPTDPSFLERERVGDADVALVSFEDDQRGLLASMLARQEGADRTMTVVDDAEYDTLFEAAGVDVAVHPRVEAAEAISRFTRGRRAENVAIVERDVAEAFEIEVESGSLLVDHTVNEAEEALPESVVVGAITRDGTYQTPRPSIEFREGDRVVAFAAADVSDDVLSRL